MIVGVDFDNTIVCYDNLFHRIAVERGLAPAEVPARKKDVRDWLRRDGKEREWTELQGFVYGPGMAGADPFPGVLEFFTRARAKALPVYIISHKTPVPAVGPAYDLHQSARNWLAAQGFFDRIGLSPEHVHFANTRQEKIRLIAKTGCTHFVDDLEETFLEQTFPPGVVKILFGQSHSHAPTALPADKLAADWSQVSKYIFDVPKS